MKSLAAKNVSEEQIVNGFIIAVCNEWKLKDRLATSIMECDTARNVANCFKMKLYKELQEKLKPWICLYHLDIATTVSFRGYEVIRQIELF